MLRFITGLLLIFVLAQADASQSDYLKELQNNARAMHLAERQEWLNLLHFKPYPLWPGGRSLADGEAFFNAPEGKTDPAAELDATLAAFFSDRIETNEQQNPQCSFIARYHWLDAHLKFDPQRLPRQTCKRFWAWHAALNPHEATLVFPAAYLNNPASMYGHTLVRIDAKDQDERTRLLAYAIGYAAATDETNGLTFAIKGLMGGYPGTYSMEPYYLKVREYNDIENRDVWEYRLSLTPEEIDRLLMHVWELGPIRFDYYFFDENCAYQLLALLDVARPGLQLTDQFRWWAIPSDTVREVVKQPGLLREAIFRPSNATVIKQRIAALTPEQQQLARRLAVGESVAGDVSLKSYAPEQSAQILELSHGYLAYLVASKGESVETNRRSRELLLARSQIAAADQTPNIQAPQTRPDQGHNTSRIGFGWGMRADQHYQELALRPSYHEQNDPEPGYTRGAQIQFFNLVARHYEDSSVRVEEFVPLDIYSLSPSDDFFKSMSWKVNAGWSRKRFENGSEPLVTRINGGAGKTWGFIPAERGMAWGYAFLDVTVETGDQFDRRYALGMGPAIGLMSNVAQDWRASFYGRAQRFMAGDIHSAAELTLLQRFTVGTQSSVRFELSRRKAFDMLWTDAQLSWQQFF